MTEALFFAIGVMCGIWSTILLNWFGDWVIARYFGDRE